MRVLQITAFSGWGCTGRIALGIHRALEAEGNKSVIAWGRINTAPDEVETIKIGNGIDQRVHGLYTRLTDRCGFASKYVTKKFLKKIDDFEPDLIQLHIMHGYYVNLEILFRYLAKKKIPVVWTFHDCWAFTGHCPYFDSVGCEKWKTGCSKCVQKKHHPTSWLIDNSEKNWIDKKKLFTSVSNLTIVTPSEWLAGLVKQSFLKDCRIEVINNGINLSDFMPTAGTIKQRLGLEGKKMVLGVSSTWAKSKGLDDFVALSNLLSDEYQIVLVGLTVDQKQKLPQSIIGIERTDSVRELAELYTAASVFVNPTYEDNYPTTNLESLACGTPVITYDTGGSVEAVIKSGYGCVVKQGDICALHDSIIRMEKNGKVVLGDLILNQQENFRKYIALYSDIIKNRKLPVYFK